MVVSKEEPKENLEARRIRDTLPVPEVNMMSHKYGTLLPAVHHLLFSNDKWITDTETSNQTGPYKMQEVPE